LNFLAHIHLSGTNRKILLGNFIGDFVKGKQFQGYPPEVARGIRLHRSIDTYTDAHPITARSRKRLHPTFGKYAGVVVDMFYDHLLAVHWGRYHQEPLPLFSNQTYQRLLLQQPAMPPRARRTLHYMVAQNWLENYQEASGLGRALTGIDARTSYKAGISQAHEALLSDWELFETEFLDFFPELEGHVQDWLGNSKNE
jgi:acyl carrier protein phosphodiesterase